MWSPENTTLHRFVPQFEAPVFRERAADILDRMHELARMAPMARIQTQPARNPPATAIASNPGHPAELIHWLNYCRYVVPELLDQYQLEPGPPPPFTLDDPLQSLRLDSPAMKRAFGLAGDMPGRPVSGVGRNDMQAAAAALSMAGFDIRDAPRDWPKNYLIWALRTIDLRDANLQNADLSGADLSGIHLEQADLRDADLTDSNLAHAEITSCDLRGANLTGTALRYASISECNFENATLARADLTACKLEYCQMAQTDCTQICLAEAQLEHVDFFEAQLAYAELYGAAIAKATFEQTDMHMIDLSDASIFDSALHGTVMTYAMFHNTDVSDCDLRDVILHGAKMYNARFLNTYLQSATLVILPSFSGIMNNYAEQIDENSDTESENPDPVTDSESNASENDIDAWAAGPGIAGQ